jgi:hypothetical protein
LSSSQTTLTLYQIRTVDLDQAYTHRNCTIRSGMLMISSAFAYSGFALMNGATLLATSAYACVRLAPHPHRPAPAAHTPARTRARTGTPSCVLFGCGVGSGGVEALRAHDTPPPSLSLPMAAPRATSLPARACRGVDDADVGKQARSHAGPCERGGCAHVRVTGRAARPKARRASPTHYLAKKLQLMLLRGDAQDAESDSPARGRQTAALAKTSRSR